MSELAVKAREEARDKAKRYVRTDPKGMKIDASGYSPPDALDADVKTGMRPLSRRAFKKGGMVEFDGYPAARRADRIARKSGGSADGFVNRDLKEANKERDGIKHVGGFKHGGRPHKLGGGLLNPAPQAGAAVGNPATAAGAGVLNGSIAPNPGSMLGVGAGGTSIANRLASGLGYKEGGKTGKWIKGAIKHPGALHKELGVKEGDKIPAKKLEKAAHSKNPVEARRARFAEELKGFHKKVGGSVSDGELEGTRPTGGRMARASGGRAGKGKTNINIVIAPGGGDRGAPPMPPMGGGPVVPPAMPVPPPMPPGGAPPMMPLGGAMPPGAPPMMGRKAGGRVYRSPKDMDAGALSGLGRIEKTEMQKSKRA